MKAQRSSKNSFRAQYTRDALVAFDGLPQSARGCFKSTFQNVVRVAAAQTVDMQIELRCLGERSPKVLGQLHRKIADLLASCLHFIDQIESPGQIDHGAT